MLLRCGGKIDFLFLDRFLSQFESRSNLWRASERLADMCFHFKSHQISRKGLLSSRSFVIKGNCIDRNAFSASKRWEKLTNNRHDQHDQGNVVCAGLCYLWVRGFNRVFQWFRGIFPVPQNFRAIPFEILRGDSSNYACLIINIIHYTGYHVRILYFHALLMSDENRFYTL